MELIVVVVITGILAALALPQYNKSKEHSLGLEAQANLKLIAAAEKVYRMERNTYIPEANIAGINYDLKLSMPSSSSRNWDYSVNPAAASTFTATATRLSGPYCPASCCQYTINQIQDDAQLFGGTCP